MEKCEQVRILGNLVRRCEQLECIIENCEYLMESRNYLKVGKSELEVKSDMQRAKDSYTAALDLLKSYCKKGW